MTILWNTLNILIIITVFQLLLLSLFLVSRRKGKKASNRILAAFLLSNACPLISLVIYRWAPSFFLQNPFFFWLGNSTAFVWGPLLYFYIKSLTGRKPALKVSDAFHLIPFILYWTYKIVVFGVSGMRPALELLIVGKIYNAYDMIVAGAFLHAVIFVYIAASLRLIRVYREEIKNAHSSLDKIGLTWLVVFTAGFGVIWLAALANSLISFFTKIPLLPLCVFNVLYILVVATAIVFWGLHQPEVFSGIESRPKYEGSTLIQSNSDLYLKKIQLFMEEQKPHLTPSLSLEDLAGRLGIPAKHLSQIINERLHKNFFDFVNGYRVEEAKKLITTTDPARTKILRIIYESGFNSKAAFHEAFKKKTGMTPSEFRKKNRP